MPSNESLNRVDAFAVTAPGLEPICARELAALNIPAAPEDGGVAWTGTMESVARANLWLRTASRVLVRVAQFRAKTFFELERHANRVPWDRFIASGSASEFRVTCRKSRLYHSGAVAQRFAEAVGRRVRGASVAAASGDAEDETVGHERQLFVVRLLHDVCTVSVDSSGALLHLRGYRQALAKAPMRETLAAAVLLGAGWDGSIALADPLCGSGTIPIEAALLARRIAPGRHRDFAMLHWPETPANLWKRLTEDADAAVRPSPVSIFGADRDAGAIEAAVANAERAGVRDSIELVQQPISALGAASPPGLVAANPPYGVRVGDRDALRSLYAQIGNTLRRQRPGWLVALLSADERLDRQTGLPLESILKTRNGGIPVHLSIAGVP